MQITVVIPTYNRYSVLKRALTSIFNQTHLAHEVIVIDDGSNDATKNIIQDFPKIRYFYQENKGVSAARNLGIEKANCDWIAFLDSDDVWHKEKLHEHLLFHKCNKEALMSYTDELWIRNSIEVNIPKKFAKYGGNIFLQSLSHCIIAPSSALVHKELFKSVGVFDESLEVCEDYDLWLRISLSHFVGLIDKKLMTKYGGDEDQLSTKHWGMDRFRVRALENLLMNAHESQIYKNEILQMLLQKYTLLLKGAIKYDKIAEIKIYRAKTEDILKKLS